MLARSIHGHAEREDHRRGIAGISDRGLDGLVGVCGS
jgi:hypothetical protein